jgi:hypothetical protein
MPIVRLSDPDGVEIDTVEFDDAFWARSEVVIRHDTLSFAPGCPLDVVAPSEPTDSMRRIDSMGALGNWLATLPP